MPTRHSVLTAIAPESAEAFERAAGEAGVPVTAIGAFTRGSGSAMVVGVDGAPMAFNKRSYAHGEGTGKQDDHDDDRQ